MVDPLLALCARAQSHSEQLQQLARLADGYEAWQSLAERAEREGLAPLAMAHLAAAGARVPEDTRRSLQALGARHRRSNSIRGSVVAEVLGRLSEAGIGTLLLKGAALAHSVYGAPGQRPMSDIDLLVKESEAVQAQALLGELGFAAPMPRTAAEQAKHHLPTAQREEGGLTVSVEVHRRLLPYGAETVAYEALVVEARTITVNGITAQTLGDEQMLWHLYRHAFTPPLNEMRLRLIWVADLVSLVEQQSQTIDWEKVRRFYPAAWHALPAIHFLTPWSPETVRRLRLAVEQRPSGVGQLFEGWPARAWAAGVQQGTGRFLASTAWPAAWWAQLYYGVECRSAAWWRMRLARHPQQIGRWLLKYGRDKRGAHGVTDG